MPDVLSKLSVIISANTAQMTGQLNKARKDIGLLTSTVNSLKGVLVGTFGAYQIIRGIQNAISTIADFEKQMSKVRAITGATGADFSRLEKNALDLGRSTEYTARQIAGLQVEYGRLGFSTKEILNSTKATLNLATATGEDLARSAEIAGSTLRAFQLDATEMGRVTDVITGALNSSALALDSFADGMKYVAPVARATNVSIEETSALLSILADSGIKGSQAGTSLRRIMTLLDKSGKPLNERLKELAANGITLADANDEVGLYAQTALLVIASQIDKVDELTGKFRNLNGETERTAEIMRDNLSGDFDKLTSAIEGTILKGDVFKGFLREITQTVTEFVSSFNDAPTAFDAFALAAASVLNPATIEIVRQQKELNKAIKERERLLANTIPLGPEPAPGLFVPKPVAPAKIGLISGLKKELEDLEAKQETASKAELTALNQSIQKIKDKIAFYERLGLLELELAKSVVEDPALPEIDTEGAKNRFGSGFLSGDIRALLDQDTTAAVAKAAEEYVNSFDRITEATEKDTKAQEENRRATEARLNSYVRLASAASDAVAQGIAGEKTFAEVLAGTTASVVDELEKQALAAIVAKAALSGTNPIAAIIGATAGFAAIKGLFAKISRGSSSATVTPTEVRGGSSSNFGSQNSSSTRPVLETQIRGSDLYVVLKNYEQNRGYTHG